MQVLGILSGAVNVPHAVHIYRITMPIAYIDKHTKHTGMWLSARSMALDLSENEIATILKSDVIVLGRMISDHPIEVGQYIEFLHRNGAKLVYETDDDLTEEYRDISNGEKKTCLPFTKNIGIDAFTVTTPYLAKQISKHSFGQPVFILPNCIETQYWAKVCDKYERKYTGTFNIMLVGTPTHGSDWRFAHQAALRILDEYPHTRLLVGGYQPDYIGDDERIVRLPFMEYAQYPTMLAEADVVIAAIDPDDPFNHSKSAVKAMEAWAAKRKLTKGYGGAAVIATNSVVYKDTIQHKRNGLLVENTVDGYYIALKELIDNQVMREYLQRTGHNDVVQRHSIQSQYTKWVSAYTQIRRLQ